MPALLLLLLGADRRRVGLPARAGAGVTSTSDVRAAESQRSASARRTLRVCGYRALVACCCVLLRRARASRRTRTCSSSPASAGDEEHATQFHKWATAIIDAAKKKDGVPDANITYLAEKPELDAARISGRSTRENVDEGVRRHRGAGASRTTRSFIAADRPRQLRRHAAAFNLPGPGPDRRRLRASCSTKLSRAAGRRSSTPRARAARSCRRSPARAATIVTATKTGGERNETRFPEFFVEAFSDDGGRSRSQRPRVGAAKRSTTRTTKVVAGLRAGRATSSPSTPTLDDGGEGKLAATLFLAPARARRRPNGRTSRSGAARARRGARRAREGRSPSCRLKKDAHGAGALRRRSSRSC